MIVNFWSLVSSGSLCLCCEPGRNFITLSLKATIIPRLEAEMTRERSERCLHLVRVWLFDRDRGRNGRLNHNPIVIFDMKINTDLRNNRSQSIHKYQRLYQVRSEKCILVYINVQRLSCESLSLMRLKWQNNESLWRCDGHIECGASSHYPGVQRESWSLWDHPWRPGPAQWPQLLWPPEAHSIDPPTIAPGLPS